MVEGTAYPAGGPIGNLTYAQAIEWCRRGWQAWRPNWPDGWFLASFNGSTYVGTPELPVYGEGTEEDRGANDWIVKADRYLDLMPHGSPLEATSPACIEIPWDNPDAEIRLQIAVREVVSRSIEDGLSASGAFRVLDHELARVGEMVESAAAA